MKFQFLVVVGVLIRVAIFSTQWGQGLIRTLEGRVEVSTPINSFKSRKYKSAHSSIEIFLSSSHKFTN
jgi:hypothetical protein